jgi:hypothetical protein
VRNGSAIQVRVFYMFCGYAAGGVAAKTILNFNLKGEAFPHIERPSREEGRIRR